MTVTGASLTHEQRARALALLDEGASIRETARTLGVGRAVIGAAFPGRGWTYREAGEFRAATRDRSREQHIRRAARL